MTTRVVECPECQGGMDLVKRDRGDYHVTATGQIYRAPRDVTCPTCDGTGLVQIEDDEEPTP